MRGRISDSFSVLEVVLVKLLLCSGLFLLFSTYSFMVNAAAPTYTLESGQWQQLVIPGDSSRSSINAIFSDDLPAQEYGVSWAIFQWDNVAGNYIRPQLTDTIATGHGFWMIQTTGRPVVLDVPELFNAPLTVAAACASIAGCSQVAFNINADTSRYVMIGSALPVSLAVDDVSLVTSGTEANCNSGCRYSQASNFGLVARQIIRYNSAARRYENLSASDSLAPWESAWIQLGTALEGIDSSFYFPSAALPQSNTPAQDPPSVEPATPALTNGECQNAPALPSLAESDPGKSIIRVSTAIELSNAMSNLTPNTVVLIEPGRYELTNTLVVRHNSVTLRGNSNSCDAVNLVGMGMENAAGASSVPHGIWTDADFLKIQNLTIDNVYNHSISIDSRASAPQIYNVRMLDAGEQFVKVNSAADGDGSNKGRLEYSVMKYTQGSPITDHGAGIGYTQGISLHSGNNWVIANNRFENINTADSADYLWNPAVLAWNSSGNTVVENNVFINVDRAIAFGLVDREDEHFGGIIRNNMVFMRENFFSQVRRSNADAPIILWGSPNTQVLHNTVVTNGNTPRAIEIRFDSNGAIIRNNLIDAPVGDRSNNQYVNVDNLLFSDTSIFRDLQNADLHLAFEVEGIADAVPTLDSAILDIDGQRRDANLVDAGADEFR